MSDSDKDLGARAANAAKWSVFAQVVGKLISPITTMVLARLLDPTAFGVVASATMVVSLADLFSDSGFQKYLIQHQFKDEDEAGRAACVAFWSNLAVSVGIVALVAVFNEPLAVAVGNPGLGMVLVVASFSLPLTAFVSVQTALYQKKLDFKTLFSSRVGSSVVTLVVSVAFALLGFDYWSMVIGTIASNAFLAAWLTVKSDWKPRFFYSFHMLRKMFSYGAWILLESSLTWVNVWAATFVLGAMMDAYYVGLYKTSTSICSSVMGIFTASLLPVVFSSLSRVQSDEKTFERVFFKSQKYLAICLVPIAFASFAYRHLLTLVLLGDQWVETETFIGLWLLAGCVVIVFGYTLSEAYRAKGMPRSCVLVQALYLVPFLPTLYISSGYGYECVALAMPAVRLSLAAINFAVGKATLGLSPMQMLSSNKLTFAQSFVSMLPGLIATSLTDSVIVAVVSAVVSMGIYVALVVAFKETRILAVELIEKMGMGKMIPSKLRNR